MTHSAARGPDPRQFVDLLEPAIREAAAAARAMEGRVANNPKLHELTRVKQAFTEADTATQEIVLRALIRHFPEVCLAAEEDTESVGRFPDDADARVIIDPIDGTLHSYLLAEGPYATIVGLVFEGLYQAGLVALPREGIFLDGRRGVGARIGMPGRAMREAHAADDGNRVLVAHNTPEAVVEHLRAQELEVIRASGGAVAVAPVIPGVCAGLRCAPGGAGISVRGRVGVLIAREAGAIVRGAGGDPFPEDPDTAAPLLLVGCNEKGIAVLRDALEAGGLPAEPG